MEKSEKVNLAEYAAISCPDCGSEGFYQMASARMYRHRFSPPDSVRVLIVPVEAEMHCMRCHRIMKAKDVNPPPANPGDETKVMVRP